MENEKTHKVVYYHEGLGKEVDYFHGTLKECIFYLLSIMWEKSNDFPEDGYEIVKL